MVQRFEVLLTAGAEQDLESIFDYIAEFDGVAKANHVLNRILKVADSLECFPGKGTYPRELAELGIKEYRQLYFKPYRLVYRIVESTVFVYAILDGRRDIESLLARRLLNS